MDWVVNVNVAGGLVESFAMDEVVKALGIVKNGKASEPTGIFKDNLAVFLHGK